ncbi:hypothetical protein [Streptomyces longwoodensis]|uniref:hypothetical protein n=1 Tax=Streptomyces longwoodensis TaxID=68231 RepID=UPI0033E60A27
MVARIKGELVVWEHGRLAFERLQQRLARHGSGAAEFDLLRLSGTDTTSWPYRRRRAALESEFAAARRLTTSWALCPSTTEADVVREWLTLSSVGTASSACWNRSGISWPRRARGTGSCE